MEGENKISDRRRYKRAEIPLPLRIKSLGTSKYGEGVKVRVKNVSLHGLLIETEVFLENDTLLLQKGAEPVNLDPFLVSGDNLLELNIKVPPHAKIINGTGRIAWYQISIRGTSYYFRAGISLEDMGVEDEKKWLNFIKNIAQVQD